LAPRSRRKSPKKSAAKPKRAKPALPAFREALKAAIAHPDKIDLVRVRGVITGARIGGAILKFKRGADGRIEGFNGLR
jgi:hypothetical protein